MKNITGFIFMIIIASSVFAQSKKITVTEYNYMNRQEIIDENGSLTINYDLKSTVDDSYYEVYYDSEKERIHMEGLIENGHKVGTWKYYNEFGLVTFETAYIEGIKDGLEKRYNLNGNIIDEINFKKGIVDGVRTQYYDNGMIRSTIEMLNGNVGKVKTYNQSGVLIEEQ